MARKPIMGTCHICGTNGKLSFEHVPPKAAFNNQSVIRVGFNAAISVGPYDKVKGRIEQRGAGDYTLCERRNNSTGRWYAPAFVAWCVQGARVLSMTDFNPRIWTLHYVLPLRVLKKIATMFFSVNGPGFAKANPELVEFVLNKNRVYLPPKYRFYVYFNRGGPTDSLRYLGIMAKVYLGAGKPMVLSEISFPPFGYVMTLDSEPPDDRLFEITHFSRYRYDDFKVLEMRPVVLDTPTLVPGDYRTPEEVVREAARQDEEERRSGGVV
jgi:hypothetical protein